MRGQASPLASQVPFFAKHSPNHLSPVLICMLQHNLQQNKQNNPDKKTRLNPFLEEKKTDFLSSGES